MSYVQPFEIIEFFFIFTDKIYLAYQKQKIENCIQGSL